MGIFYALDESDYPKKEVIHGQTNGKSQQFFRTMKRVGLLM